MEVPQVTDTFMYLSTSSIFLIGLLSVFMAFTERRRRISVVWRILTIRYLGLGAYNIVVLYHCDVAKLTTPRNMIEFIFDIFLLLGIFAAVQRVLRRLPHSLSGVLMRMEEEAPKRQPFTLKLPNILNPKDPDSLIKNQAAAEEK